MFKKLKHYMKPVQMFMYVQIFIFFTLTYLNFAWSVQSIVAQEYAHLNALREIKATEIEQIPFITVNKATQILNLDYKWQTYGLGETGEIFIVDRTNTIITYSRKFEQANVKLDYELNRQQRNYIATTTMLQDYLVSSRTLNVNNRNWIIVAQISKLETLQFSYTIILYNIVFVIIIAFILVPTYIIITSDLLRTQDKIIAELETTKQTLREAIALAALSIENTTERKIKKLEELHNG